MAQDVLVPYCQMCGRWHKPPCFQFRPWSATELAEANRCAIVAAALREALGRREEDRRAQ